MRGNSLQTTNGRGTRQREVLRQAGVVLQGRVVGLWAVTEDGHLELLQASAPNVLSADSGAELEATLHRWPQALESGRYWVGCRLDHMGRWCAAPVRDDTPGPPPHGLERRSRERMTLELAGLCIGLMDRASASRD